MKWTFYALCFITISLVFVECLWRTFFLPFVVLLGKMCNCAYLLSNIYAVLTNDISSATFVSFEPKALVLLLCPKHLTLWFLSMYVCMYVHIYDVCACACVCRPREQWLCVLAAFGRIIFRLSYCTPRVDVLEWKKRDLIHIECFMAFLPFENRLDQVYITTRWIIFYDGQVVYGLCFNFPFIFCFVIRFY